MIYVDNVHEQYTKNANARQLADVESGTKVFTIYSQYNSQHQHKPQ